MLDLLDYFVMPAELAATHHLEGNANPLYTALWPIDPKTKTGKIWWMKGKGGNPWDIELYDSDYLYHWITEWQDAPPNNFWSVPQNYKRFDNNGWPAAGVAVAPRFIPSSMLPGCSVQLFTPGSQGHHVKSCQNFVASGVADILGVTHPPFPMNNGGDIPDGTPTVVTEYFWGGHGGVYTTRERYFGALGFGLVAWDSASIANPGGLPTVKNSTQYNKLVAGGAPKPNFPCTNP